jgi:hypothetical protein
MELAYLLVLLEHLDKVLLVELRLVLETTDNQAAVEQVP